LFEVFFKNCCQLHGEKIEGLNIDNLCCRYKTFIFLTSLPFMAFISLDILNLDTKHFMNAYSKKIKNVLGSEIFLFYFRKNLLNAALLLRI